MAKTKIHGDNQVKSGSIAKTVIKSNAGIQVSKLQTVPKNTILIGSALGVAAVSKITKERVNETPNGAVVLFTIDYTPVANSEKVFLNGNLQRPTNDYGISGKNITFVTAPITGDDVTVSYYTADSVSATDAETILPGDALFVSGDLVMDGSELSLDDGASIIIPAGSSLEIPVGT